MHDSMNGWISFQDRSKRLLQRIEVRGVGGNVQRGRTQPTERIDLVFNSGVVFMQANPDHIGLVVFDHEPAPYFAKTPRAADDDVNPFLSVVDWRRLGQYWNVSKLLMEPFTTAVSQTVASFIRGHRQAFIGRH